MKGELPLDRLRIVLRRHRQREAERYNAKTLPQELKHYVEQAMTELASVENPTEARAYPIVSEPHGPTTLYVWFKPKYTTIHPQDRLDAWFYTFHGIPEPKPRARRVRIWPK